MEMGAEIFNNLQSRARALPAIRCQRVCIDEIQ